MPSSNFKHLCPYTVGIVRFEEGPAISGLIVSDKDDLLIVGSKVTLNIIREGERSILGFKVV